MDFSWKTKLGEAAQSTDSYQAQENVIDFISLPDILFAKVNLSPSQTWTAVLMSRKVDFVAQRIEVLQS